MQKSKREDRERRVRQKTTLKERGKPRRKEAINGLNRGRDNSIVWCETDSVFRGP
jgi:hypothetical protein